MQTNEIVSQVKQVARLPEMDEAPVAKRPAPETRAKRHDAGASGPVTVQLPDFTVEPKRSPRRFGAGF